MAIPGTDDFTLQWEKNASGTWNFLSGAVVAYDDPNLTEGAATTNRLTGGTGTFVAGKVSEDGSADDVGWSGNNYTELVFSVRLVAAQLANGDTLRFRVVKNAVTTDMTYAVTPTVNITTLPPVTKNLQAVWHTKARIGDTAQAVWHTRTRVGDTVQALWDVDVVAVITMGYPFIGASGPSTSTDLWQCQAIIEPSLRHTAVAGDRVTQFAIYGDGDGIAAMAVYVISANVPTTRVGSAVNVVVGCFTGLVHNSGRHSAHGGCRVRGGHRLLRRG